MTGSREQPSLLVLGLGNVLCSDDGLGVVAVERLARQYRIPGNVAVMDGGTLGLSLLWCFEEVRDAILVDAIRADGPAASFVRLEGNDVAPAIRDRLSCHQVGVADLLDGLRWLDAYPARLVLLGLIPETLELRVGRSRPVERRLQFLVERIVEEAQRLGYELAREATDETAVSGCGGAATRALGL